MSLKVSAWAIRTPPPVLLMRIVLTLAGIVACLRLPVKQLPNVEFPIVAVSVTRRGAAPAKVEAQITRPVANALAGIAELRHVTSTVSLGASSTVAEFKPGGDMRKGVDDVRTAIERIRVQLPQGIDPPSTRRVDIAGTRSSPMRWRHPPCRRRNRRGSSTTTWWARCRRNRAWRRWCAWAGRRAR